jgi:hypothetical protein
VLSLKSVRLWLRRYTQTWFPVWTLKRRLARFWRQYESEYEEAKKQRNRDKMAEIQFFASEYSDELGELESKKLLRRAARLFVSLNDLLEDPDSWYTGTYGNRYIVGRVEYDVRRRVTAAERENREHWARIAGPLIAAITGLIGVVTGLVAVLSRK